MSETATAVPAGKRLRAWRPWVSPGGTGRAPWLPAWSRPAALRALRATLVVPGLFALTFKVIGDPQLTVFSVFGGFATLVLASFGGSRRDRAIAHLGLAATGSVALIIGTAVSGTTWLAALVTVPVAFAIFFAGVAGPNAASGVTAALLAYVLSVASPGTAAMIGPRLAGWWLASAVSTAAVLLLSPRPPGDRLKGAAARSASALADHLTAAVRGQATPALREASLAATHDLMSAFSAAPYRPTGLATPDQALTSVIHLLEWCSSQICDAMDGHLDLSQAAAPDRDLLEACAGVLAGVSSLLAGGSVEPDTAGLERARAASAAHQRRLTGDPDRVRRQAAHAFHAQVIAVTARAAAADAMIAARRADPGTIAAQRRRWYGAPEAGQPPAGRFPGLAGRFPGLAGRFPGLVRWLLGLAGAAGLIARYASLRSVWFRNSARGAVALAAAVAVADLSGVQHAFWVALGTMSVLRTNAASTGSTAWRALGGTAAGFAVGAALLLAIGTGQAALWTALVAAVLVASYAPGTAPFTVGQAAFTITVVVLYNLLVPVGWRVGLLRIEDVALGCAVSLVVGVLFWPRGAAAVVGDDLADAFRRGGSYLAQAVDWSLGLRPLSPGTGVAAITAGIRLDDALRGYLAEQGAKRMSKEDLWSLVMGAMRVRLTANSLAGLHLPAGHRADGPGADGQGKAAPGSDGPGADGQGKAAPGSDGPGADGQGKTAPETAVQDGQPGHTDPVRVTLRQLAAELAGFYERIAVQVGHPVPPGGPEPAPVAVPVAVAAETLAGPGVPADGSTGHDHYHPNLLWVREHLYHLGAHAQAMTAPATRVARLRREPWWR